MLGNRSLGIDHSDPKVVDKELQKPMPEPVSPPLVIVSPQPRHFTHAHTEPAPLRGGSIRPEFPHALVMSGLDHANMAEQMSLAHALTERLVIIEALKHEAGHNEPRPRGLSSGTHESDPRRGSSALLEDSAFEGTWNVPDDFILIYVCPWDARERPKIHKTLVRRPVVRYLIDMFITFRYQLDRFAMSSTIFVSQHIRQALRALPFTSNPIPRSRLLSLSHSSPPTPSPLQPRPPAPQSRTPPALTRALPGTNHPPHCNSSHPPPPPPPLVPKQLIPREFLLFLQGAAQRAHLSSNLSLYLSDLFSAVRHHPRLDGTFLTARALNDARALARAGRIFGTDPTGGELLRGHHGLELFDDDEGYEEDESQTSFKEYNDVASGSGSVTINIPREKTPSPLPSREGSTTKGHHDQTLADEPPAPDPLETLFVSEADIARIFPRVVTHRLRVRDGPEDEVLASAIFGATFEDTVQDSNAAPGYGWDTRSTVKDVLVEVLAEV
ncbi:hypothetical protein D9615_009618 [Tricholomella constricta]|uniref:Uncharacterized protein n=1 Tax=Tricholomella constricta TaxID=117010 RepID=A0A8H5GUL0_9AGAR|nr:hypothetical protein D9615_009618 [Tricholomella constricta]